MYICFNKRYIMKKILLIIVFLKSFMIMSQNIVYHGYKSIPFKSDVWRIEYKGSGDSIVGVIYPKEGKYFKMNFIPVRDKIDEVKVRQYLLPSFNQFRKDNNLSNGVENVVLTEIATKWAKQIPNIMTAKHSNILLHPLKKDSEWLSEGICNIPYTQLTMVPENTDINKIIADCVYDALSICPAHASDLIHKCDNFEIGFGLDFRATEVIVVLQYRNKKGDN